MNSIKVTKDDDEAKTIIAILALQSRRAECGSFVKIPVIELLETEETEQTSEEYVYGIISNYLGMCKKTGSKCYKINWEFHHLPIGNTNLSLIAPVFEHDFTVVFFPEEVDSEENNYFTDQFKKKKGEWMIVKYGVEKCKFCDLEMKCEREESKEVLEGMLEEFAVMEGRTDDKQYRMYRCYTAFKYGVLGRRVRRKLDDCVVALILKKIR